MDDECARCRGSLADIRKTVLPRWARTVLSVELFAHHDVGAVFFVEDVAVEGIALFHIEFACAVLCAEDGAGCAFAFGDSL